MSTVSDRVAFAERHYTTPDGQPFSLAGRDWVLDQYWRPLDGHKLWPVDAKHLCGECSRKAGLIVESHDADEPTRSKAHAAKHGGCLGLACQPILMVVLALPRQSGKTLNTAAWALSKIAIEESESIEFVASAEDQSERLFDKNYRRPIAADAKLRRAFRVVGSTITAPATRSDFEYVSTSLSAVGDTRTVVIVDEARTVPADVAVAVLPTLFARGGFQCSRNRRHVKTHLGVEDATAPKLCPVCKSSMAPWYGRALIMSSGGILSDGEGDWFAELVEHLQANPHPNVHLFTGDGKENPKTARKLVGMVGDVFGALASTRAYADVEAGETATFRRKGEDFLSRTQLDAITDQSLENHEGGSRPCVAFLDTSISGDLTSLIICEDDSHEDDDDAFAYLATTRIDVWNPAKLRGGVIDEAMLLAHLDEYVPRFPLVALAVDTRLMPWASRLVREVRKSRPWGRIVQGVTWRDVERSAAWALFEQRALARPRPRIRLQSNEQLRKELLGARRTTAPDGKLVVREPNRRRHHLDIAEGVASCCYLAHLQTLTHRVGLAERQRRSTMRSVLDAAFRPTVGRMTQDSF